MLYTSTDLMQQKEKCFYDALISKVTPGTAQCLFFYTYVYLLRRVVTFCFSVLHTKYKNSQPVLLGNAAFKPNLIGKNLPSKTRSQQPDYRLPKLQHNTKQDRSRPKAQLINSETLNKRFVQLTHRKQQVQYFNKVMYKKG